jgi:hypothetical protein
MNEQAACILTSLVARYGTSMALDPLRCEGLLRDTCPRCNREIFVLVNAVRQQIPADLLAPRHSLPPALFRGFLVKRLQDELAFSDEAAHWAVNTWAGALGLDNGSDPQEPTTSVSPASKRPRISFPDDTCLSTRPDQRAAWARDLESENLETRISAVREMGQLPDAETVRLLISCFENSSWKIRAAAFDTLLETGEPAVPGLIEALTDTHERVIIPTVILLATVRSRQAVEPLIGLMDAVGESPVYAIWALGEIGDDRAITPLTKVLKGSLKLRSHAEQALQKFG